MGEEKAARRLAAILAADIAGYSRLRGEDEPATVRALKGHQARVLPLVGEYGGRIIDTAGDGILAEFSSVVGAVECAVKMQAIIAAYNQDIAESRRMQLRIGINLGDVIHDETRIYGDGINVAARLEALAEPGGICLSSKVHDEIRDKIALHFRDLGEMQLKNIARPVRVYALEGEAGPDPGAGAKSVAPRRARKARLLAAGATIAIAMAGAGAWLWSQRTVISSAARSDTKSIAVLPFANMSDDKETSLFFADGIHEDILTNLALIRELRVVSRTSVMQYRDTKKPIRQIGQELGVAYLLEGSVRRAGTKLRVTSQLINAQTDEHVWARTYDRELNDVFAIQAALAQDIAGSLQAALSPQEKFFLERRPTENLAAYELFLQARDTSNREGIGLSAVRKREGFLEKAVELDSRFAAAWGELSVLHAQYVFLGFDASDARLAKAKAASERSVQLAPDSPDVIRALGNYYYYGYHDYAQAKAQYARLARLQPNDPTVYLSIGLIQRRQGQWAESLGNVRAAARLDPGNVGMARVVSETLLLGRRFDEAMAAQSRLVGMLPKGSREEAWLAYVAFLAGGSTKEMEEWLARLPVSSSILPGFAIGAGSGRRAWAMPPNSAASIVFSPTLLKMPCMAAIDLRKPWPRPLSRRPTGIRRVLAPGFRTCRTSCDRGWIANPPIPCFGLNWG